LLHSVSEGSRTAFDMLYRAYYDKVFRFAYSVLRDREACREVVSNVFLSIWQYRKKLKDVENHNAYFYVVTRNEAMRFRRFKRNCEIPVPKEFLVTLKNRDESHPESVLVDKELENLLTQAINELPERCRLVFTMARMEGLTPREIGEILSVTESTVRVQMRIAVGKIIERIRRRFPDFNVISG